MSEQSRESKRIQKTRFSQKKIGVFLLFFTFLLFLDQYLKVYVVKYLLFGQSYPIIQNVLHCTLTYNKGIAFSLFKFIPPYIWICIQASIVCVFLFFIIKYKKYTQQEFIPFGLIVTGAIGNLIDRMMNGFVIDFIDLRVWPVFNLADSYISIGAMLLIVCMLRKKNCRPTIK